MKQIFHHKYDSTLPIIFFDRDGVITKAKDFLLHPKDIELYSSAIKAIKLLNTYQFPIVVITNQPAVARGWVTEKEIIDINREIIRLLNRQGAYVHAVYCCPHHPQATLAKYRTVCACRKPGTQFISDAMSDLHTQVKTGYMIGDKTTDILTGTRAGLTTFLVQTGYKGQDSAYRILPNYTCKNALAAATTIFSLHTQPAHR